ncbi:MAG: type VI secretion system baseplate subunit TssK [Proteobacteria bacterium]|nr:type VI secretion system baseplate subunit TssK [Pseudomonadota bacterium]
MGQIPEAICWSEGMQLLPQHFQQQSLRAEILAAQLASAAQPYYWGVLNVEIDEAALIGGTLRVLALEAILPDGLWLCIKPGVHPPLELNFQDLVAASSQHPLTLYLVVPPLYRAGELDASGRRYVSQDGKDIPDLVSKESPAVLTFWRPDLAVLDEQHRADGVCLPLLRVEEGAGGFARKAYFAPQPKVLPESLLGKRIAALCTEIRGKCAFLAGRLRQALQDNNEGDSARIDRQLAALWARLPELQSALDSRVAHPLALYLILNGVAGSVCALNPQAGVPAFRAFNYEELLACFDDVIGFIMKSVTRIKAGYRRSEFALEKVGFVITPPLSLRQGGQWVIGVQMPSSAGDDAARLWLDRAVIASMSQLETLQRQRMRGVLYRPLDRQEQLSYSVGEDTRLFSLYEFGEWFNPDEPLCIAVPAQNAATEPLSVVLFVPEASDDIPVLSEADHD